MRTCLLVGELQFRPEISADSDLPEGRAPGVCGAFVVLVSRPMGAPLEHLARDALGIHNEQRCSEDEQHGGGYEPRREVRG